MSRYEPDDRKPLHCYLSNEAHTALFAKCYDLNISVTSMMEALIPFLEDIADALPELAESAVAIDKQRRQRGRRRRSA